MLVISKNKLQLKLPLNYARSSIAIGNYRNALSVAAQHDQYLQAYCHYQLKNWPLVEFREGVHYDILRSQVLYKQSRSEECYELLQQFVTRQLPADMLHSLQVNLLAAQAAISGSDLYVATRTGWDTEYNLACVHISRGDFD